MKKSIALLAVCIAVFGTLYATGSKESSAVGAATGEVSGDIIVLHHRTDMEDKFEEYKAQFAAVYPNVHVEFEAVHDYAGTVRTRMSTKSYGDVLMVVTAPPFNSDLGKFYEPMGSFADLNQKYDFLESAQQYYFDGIVYGVPINANAGGLLYNKQVFKKAGITEFPTTSDEFYACLAKIKKNTAAIPFFMNYPSKWTLTQWEGGRLAYAGDPDWGNKMIHMDAPFSKGMPHYELYKVMYEVVKRGLCEQDLLTSDWEKSKQDFVDGKIGVMNLGSWAISQFRDIAAKSGYDPDAVVGYMPYPVSHDGVVYAEPSLDYAIGVNKYSENKAAAKAWALWFANRSSYAKDNVAIPALKGSEFPAVLDSFKEVGVVFKTQLPAHEGEEGLLDKLDSESEIGLWQDPQKVRIVDAAMGTTKETFDDIMNDWNARWAKARKTLNVTP
ncbi:ABC transporter substrate-binding protein [Treponema brennaborense]|uniref:Extracellular solute-binding protein family 1 n=1 Tax=Treponema brennaborense (strain DSM 12168 / CIP 105900 / DD5/3) TaxID=906968 RepID=F4LJ96_TREBD|nr:ABC transporter substrate-binding protein [Treponema brennaborense]AEE17341.1 extracellular solute-binding protein family 1 [Treponema brennaborense DSM 12168]